MWTPEHRAAARRQDLRYASDLTDEEWALVAPMIPPARRGGRPRDVNMREVINGLHYLLWTGCQWQALPKDLPPKSTVHHWISPRLKKCADSVAGRREASGWPDDRRGRIRRAAAVSFALDIGRLDDRPIRSPTAVARRGSSLGYCAVVW
jgi:transposase